MDERNLIFLPPSVNFAARKVASLARVLRRRLAAVLQAVRVEEDETIILAAIR